MDEAYFTKSTRLYRVSCADCLATRHAAFLSQSDLMMLSAVFLVPHKWFGHNPTDRNACGWRVVRAGHLQIAVLGVSAPGTALCSNV
eukprot:1156532-Pelagomonas_calceolata.AAC.13